MIGVTESEIYFRELDIWTDKFHRCSTSERKRKINYYSMPYGMGGGFSVVEKSLIIPNGGLSVK